MSDTHHTGHGRCGSCGDAGAVARMRDAERLKADLTDDYRDGLDYWDHGECECLGCARGCRDFDLDEDRLGLAPLRVPLIDVARSMWRG